MDIFTHQPQNKEYFANLFNFITTPHEGVNKITIPIIITPIDVVLFANLFQ